MEFEVKIVSREKIQANSIKELKEKITGMYGEEASVSVIKAVDETGRQLIVDEDDTYYATCPYGCIDCVNDPAYINHNYPDRYKKFYSNKTPEEVSKEYCMCAYKEDSTYCNNYDNEDK